MKHVLGRTDSELCAWNSITGELMLAHEFQWPEPAVRFSADQRLRIQAFDRLVVQTDRTFKYTPREKALRVAKAQPIPSWHAEEAVQAVERDDWYAATFHAAWFFKLRPDSRSAHESFHASFNQLDPDVAKLTPAIVAEALALPKP